MEINHNANNTNNLENYALDKSHCFSFKRTSYSIIYNYFIFYVKVYVQVGRIFQVLRKWRSASIQEENSLKYMLPHNLIYSIYSKR